MVVVVGGGGLVGAYKFMFNGLWQRRAKMCLHSDVNAMFGALKDGEWEPSTSSSADRGDNAS